MKKYISLFLLVLVFALSGCGQKTAYEEMVNDIGNIKSMQYAMVEVGANVKSVDFNYKVEMDSKAPLAHVSFLGQDVYLSDKDIYAQILGSWYTSPLSADQIAAIKDETDFDLFKIDMPDGDSTINITSGYDQVDKAVNGKTYNDVVVATDTGFTITGLEDVLKITAKDSQLSLEFSDPSSDDTAHLTLGKADKFSLPSDAKDATAVPASVLENL